VNALRVVWAVEKKIKKQKKTLARTKNPPPKNPNNRPQTTHEGGQDPHTDHDERLSSSKP
jgi:hypothetical protein